MSRVKILFISESMEPLDKQFASTVPREGEYVTLEDVDPDTQYVVHRLEWEIGKGGVDVMITLREQ